MRSLIRNIDSCLRYPFASHVPLPARRPRERRRTAVHERRGDLSPPFGAGPQHEPGRAQTRPHLTRGALVPESDVLYPNTDDRALAPFKTCPSTRACSPTSWRSVRRTRSASTRPSEPLGCLERVRSLRRPLHSSSRNMAFRPARTGTQREFFHPPFPPFSHPFAITDRQTVGFLDPPPVAPAP